MSERCDSRFDDNGSDLLCEKPKGHEGFHEYGDWEWWDENSPGSPDALAKQQPAPTV